MQNTHTIENQTTLKFNDFMIHSVKKGSFDIFKILI